MPMMPMSFDSDYDRIKYYYDHGWATKAQVAKYVVYGKITPEQYEAITGDPYPGV